MSARMYSRFAGVFFTFVALVHAYRLAAFFPIQIGPWSIPQAGSWIGLGIAGALGFLGLRASR